MCLFDLKQTDSYDSIQAELGTYPLLEIWRTAPNSPITKVRQNGSDYWLSCAEYGAIRIACENLEISTFPKNEADASEFEFFLSHEWLPMAYQICGTQVLHASAVVNLKNNRILAFCGDTGSGKSTFGFGFAQHKGWIQIADDRLAFQIENNTIKPVFIPNHVQLRPKSADHFGEIAYDYQICQWIDSNIVLDTVFFLTQVHRPSPGADQLLHIQPVSKADSFKLLLKQAFALTTKSPDHNQIIMNSYLTLANQIHAYQLDYTSEFKHLNEIFNAIDEKINQVW